MPGQIGVERVLSTLSEELDLVMALCGARDLSEVTADLLGPVPGQSAWRNQRRSLPGGA